MGKDKIVLNIAGVPAGRRERVEGWEAEAYSLDGAARGGEVPAPRIELDPDTVLELELANGVRILVSAEDAGRYLGEAVGRGAGGTGEIQVGPLLRLSGTHMPAGLSRDGLGAWLLSGLKLYKQGPAAMAAVAAAGAFQDAQLDDRNGLYRCAPDSLELTRVQSLPAATQPSLIFIHGTASSTPGSFRDLWAIDSYREKLVGTYANRIYAFEHRSLTESPVANALALAQTLPRGARVHLVTHSRGGMVGELLARANRRDLEPFTDAEIERFRQQGRRLGHDGYEEDAQRLAELNRELVKRGIRVERFVRVACPARGTTLASGRLDRWASVMLNLLGRGFDATGQLIPGAIPLINGFHLLKRFLLAVVRERTDARILPGMEAMMPDSPLVGLLNSPDTRIDAPLHVLAGDFQGEGLLPWLGDCLSEVFYGGETDLVVNTPSMSGGAAREQGIFLKPVSGPQVTHFSYFQRDESALALLAALGGDDSRFERLPGPSQAHISRGGRDVKRKADAPIVFLLPGIMGSHIQLGRDRIWFEPFSMVAGEMARLGVDARGASLSPDVTPDGWMDRNYEMLARYLADTHEVRPFAYDWRLSIVAAAERFGRELDRAMQDAGARGKPLRIVAHSMGGLVARLALKDRWEAFKAIPGSRLLQLGTPNAGSHSIAAVLMARDDFVQTIERWFDWQHDMREFLEIVRDFPGVLELLPWPGDNGLAVDGNDYFDAGVWQDWFDRDRDGRKGKSWRPPRAEPLAYARAAITALRGAGLDPACTLYVAGHAPTPIGVRITDGQVEIGWIEEGDGRVPWKTGIPPQVAVWYTEAVHGDLANHSKAYAAYLELLETGDTRDKALSRVPPGARGPSVPVFRPRGLTSHALYPSVEEVLAAAAGGARPGRRSKAGAEPPATIQVVHGSLASAETPVLIGAYAHDSLRGSAKFLDGHLAGQLARTYDQGRYPARPEDAMVFLNPEPDAKPAGAIVVGLGPLGELMPGRLGLALVNGLLEYARHQATCRPGGVRAPERLEVSALLVGTGFTGLTVEVGAQCLLEAVRRANIALAETEAAARIARVTLYEEQEDRALAALQALADIAGDARFADSVRVDDRLRGGAGGYRGRCVASGGEPGAYRALVVEEQGRLRFTVITDRARNEVVAEADQRQAVDGLIEATTGTTRDQPGLSRALFELLVPNAMKGAVADLRTLMMSLDAAAAAYPWELMRDGDQPGDDPLAVRVELVRQLASAHGRGRVPTVTENGVFVVGDTQSGMLPLPGAQAEARTVARVFAGRDYEVKELYAANAQDVFEALFYRRYRFMHLAGHGVVDYRDEDSGPGVMTGMVLGRHTFLTAAQVDKLRHVPEFVFINCCHLGAMKADAQPRWGELAANLATQFIEMGCKAVIAAGWAVDDLAANTFAQTFYEAMLAGRRFGQAVLAARKAAYENHPQTNTWGAYQAYGDERYRFPVTDPEEESAGAYLHTSQLVADLDRLSARLQGATGREREGYYRKQMAFLERTARGPGFQSGLIKERLAAAWADLGDPERAIALYRESLGMEDAGAGLRALEQLANLEIRQGARLAEAGHGATDGTGGRRGYERGMAYMDSGLARVRLLLEVCPTGERYDLLASHWKRRAQAYAARGYRRGIRDCLAEMEKAYWQAAELTRNRTGEWDYYPLLNALDAAWLSAARGDGSGLDRRAGELSALLLAAGQNCGRRFAEQRVFFHALGAVEVQRVDALWACHGGRGDACLTRKEVQAGLAARYCDLMRRMGGAGEHDAVLNHLRFLADMLPSRGAAKQMRQALRDLANALEQCLTRQ